jgi:hypothetical protein
VENNEIEYESIYDRIYMTIGNLRESLKLRDSVTFVAVPVIYGPAYDNANFVGWTASTINMVNSIMDGNRVYSTDPGNEQFRQLFTDAVAPRVAQFTQGDDSQLAWNLHRERGELHCTSNAKRKFPTNALLKPWWEYSEYINWMSE